MRPIIIIGAGGIVNDAHLPAYKIAGFEVAGIYDVDKEKARSTAEKFSIPLVYEDMQSFRHDVIFDIAVPGAEMLNVLKQLPANSVALLQKPMGHNYTEAKQVLQVARDKKMIAAVNFQLRYAPYILEAKRIMKDIGELCDIEVNVNVYTPWHLWKFLYDLPRTEILYHSIHYIDLVRSLLGNPVSIYAKTVKHPSQKDLASVRTSIIMDYGDIVCANILTNHQHNFGNDNQQSYIKFEGTRGAVKIQMGLLMNYPQGLPDKIEYILEGESKWTTIQPQGSWFPHAFIGSMEQVMLAAEGKIKQPDNSVEDCIDTMACVEAAYMSSEQGGVKLNDLK